MNRKNSFFKEKARYSTAVALIILIAVVLVFQSTFILWLVLGIFFLMGLKESLKLFNSPYHILSLIYGALIWIFALLHSNPVFVGVFFLMLLAGILAYKRAFSARYLLVYIYPTLPFLCLLEIYKDFGSNALIWLIVIISLCDIAAYFGGRAFGHTPLCSSSPKKTVEGAIIGITVATCIGSLIGVGILPQVGFFSSIGISFIVSISGIFGDLFESYLKREMGLKDSGSILPGHGGIMDRFDAVLFGAIALVFVLHLEPLFETTVEIPLS